MQIRNGLLNLMFVFLVPGMFSSSCIELAPVIIVFENNDSRNVHTTTSEAVFLS